MQQQLHEFHTYTHTKKIYADLHFLCQSRYSGMMYCMVYDVYCCTILISHNASSFYLMCYDVCVCF